MKYSQIVPAIFLERPNRFIAYVELAGKKETVHVKNTGRCGELLKKGVRVYLEKSSNPERKTAYDLVAVEKGNLLINMDSQAPNKAVEEWLYKKQFFPDLIFVRPETVYGNSRFDFYIEHGDKKAFMEVKGVTLEQDGMVSFPDAPSERAVKHLEELMAAGREGYEVYVLFVVQMKGAACFAPNEQRHPGFARALREAHEAGVRILAYDCLVSPEGMELDAPVLVKTGSKKEMAGPLLKWYDNNRRILPWREEPKPYRVWVSEIMLQQTRVEAVKPYFERFMKSLPEIKDLAEATEDTILKLWEGLGYYSRVRNMQKAAITIMEDYGGKMPQEYEELKKLPGIGSYTAGAISSIAFQKKAPAVDGNVLRVLSRLTMEPEDILTQKVKKKMEELIIRLIPNDRPGDFNQAMIEIGATVCVPNAAPRCAECPLAEYCLAHQNGCATDFPQRAAKKQRKIEEKTVLIIRDGEKGALRKRPKKGLLAGMYEFPMLEGTKSSEEVLAYCSSIGLKPLRIQELAQSKHMFSHKEWHMKGYAVRVDELSETRGGEEDWLFVRPEEAQERYPVPAAFGAYTSYLNIRLGNDKFIEESPL